MKMLQYELKKIFLKPVNRAMLVLLLAIVLVGSFLAIRDVKYYRGDNPELSGPLAARELRNAQKQWEGPVTEDVLRRVVKENKAINDSAESADIGFAKKQGFADLINLICVAFSEPGKYDPYLCDTISPDKAAKLYERRISRLEKEISELETGLPGAFSEKEQEYLIRQYKNLKTPLYYESAEGWKALLDSQYLPTLMIIIIVIIGFLVSGIFSDEFQLKADAIFFSAKLGRNKAILAKIKAGLLAITVLYWFAMLLFSAIILGTLGIGGARCMVQLSFSNWECMYNITFFQEWLLCMFGGYIGNLFILTLAMFVSAKSRSAVLSIAVPFVLSCVPMFLGRVPALADFMSFFPDMLLRINKFLGDFVFCEIGGTIFGVYTVLIPCYLFLSLVLFPMIYYGYKKMGAAPARAGR